jgi:hypothetical protein
MFHFQNKFSQSLISLFAREQPSARELRFTRLLLAKVAARLSGEQQLKS